MSDSLLELATAAHYGTSFVPEERGRQYVAEYEAHLSEMREWMAEHVPADALEQEFERYRARYTASFRAYLSAKGRTLSPMITGPAKFPTRRNQKALESEHRRLQELLALPARAQEAIARRYRPDPRDEARAELAKLEAQLAMMKAANPIIRSAKLSYEAKVARLVAEFGISEASAHQWLKPYAGRLGFPAFQLASLRGKIARRRALLESAERAEATEAQEFPGLRVEEDASDNRLRLYFDGKPDEATRALLKRNGFRWAPSAGAWQRQLTDNARAVLRSILPTLTADA